MKSELFAWRNVHEDSSSQILFLPIQPIFPFLKVTKHSILSLGNCPFPSQLVLVGQLIPCRHSGRPSWNIWSLYCSDKVSKGPWSKPGQLEIYLRVINLVMNVGANLLCFLCLEKRVWEWALTLTEEFT